MKRTYFYNFCTKLNQTIRTKFLFFDYYHSKKSEYLCYFLLYNKLIYNFNLFPYFCKKLLKTKFKLKLYLVLFKNKPIFRGFFLKKNSKSLVTKKLYQIRTLRKNRKNSLNPLLILQTSLGILTNFEAEKKKLGGFVLGKMYL